VLDRLKSGKPIAAVDDDLFHPSSGVQRESSWRQCVRRGDGEHSG